jgi:predicted unusual protein kinase regulating ubiquinone biosynthesis (AarF/ABC1/UbiB family)
MASLDKQGLDVGPDPDRGSQPTGASVSAPADAGNEKRPDAEGLRRMTPGDDGIPTGRLRRSAPVASLVARTTGEAVVKALRRKVTGSEVTVDHERAAERYAQLLGRSRGALIKAGQALSFVSLAESVSPEARVAYERALSRLREDAPPMPAAVAREVLEAELGRPTQAAYAEFEWEPLAAASIGQVHRARLHDGRPVAVKIQYPGVGAAIDADLANHQLLTTFMSLLMSFAPRRIGLDVKAIATEMAERIRAELDYGQEAANQREFADFYRGHPFIRIPEVVDELSTDRVLTQDLVEGLTWEQAREADEWLREQWAQAVFRFGQGSFHVLEIVNVDPHPGNYRFHRDGTVSFLDFGCVIRISPETSEPLTRLLDAILRGDAQATWRAAVDLGVWKADDPVTPQEAFDYWHEPMEMFWGPQPFRITSEVVAAGIERHNSPYGPSPNAVRYINSPEGFAFLSRLDFGALSVIAGLDVALNWRAMAMEFYDNQPPSTEQSKLHWDFIAVHHPSVRRHA